MSGDEREAERAASVARQIVESYADAAAIETADYRECSFILEAARLADEGLAARLGARLEQRQNV